MKQGTLGLILLLAVTFVAGHAYADDDLVILQLRTDGIPGVHFDSVRTVLFRIFPDGSRVLEGTYDHVADPGADYARGVRLAEIRLGNGRLWEGTTTLLRSGGLTASRPWRVRFDHDHLHYFDADGLQQYHQGGTGWPEMRVITLLIPFAFEPIEEVTKNWSFFDDADMDLEVTPCDVLLYTVEFTTTHEVSRAVFHDDPRPSTRLIPGSVTTTHGRVLRGNRPADSDVFVRFGFVPEGQKVTVTFLAQVPPVSNQGQLTLDVRSTLARYSLLTDDPSRPGDEDPTVVPDCTVVQFDDLLQSATAEEIARSYESVTDEFIASSLFAARELIHEARAMTDPDPDQADEPGDQDQIPPPPDDGKPGDNGDTDEKGGNPKDDGEKGGDPKDDGDGTDEYLSQALEDLVRDGERQLILRRDAALEAAEANGASRAQLDRIWKSAKFGMKTVKEIMKRLDPPSNHSSKD